MFHAVRRSGQKLANRTKGALGRRRDANDADLAQPDAGTVVVQERPAAVKLDSPIGLNKLCEVEDWQDPRRADAMRDILPYFIEISRSYPTGMEHRKHWEYAQLLCGMRTLGGIRPDGLVISIGAGHEEPIYYLTKHVRWVFACDVYGRGIFQDFEADAQMLVDPDRFARFSYKPNRLVVQWMDALALRHEDETFDAAFSLSSIEHFGDFNAACRALAEMGRVTRRGGIVAIATECIVNRMSSYHGPEFNLFTPTELEQLSRSVPELQLVEPIDFGISSPTLRKVKPLSVVMAEARQGFTDYPSIVMDHAGRHYTSIMLFWRRRDV